jgi:hypothetical protein
MSTAAPQSPSRIASIDQFRGYTVAGMCLVNFLAPFLSAPAELKHNESWFSYADSIMPSFFFVVGYSFRLTYLRRRATSTSRATARTYLRRSLVLFGLSFAIYALTIDWSRWADSSTMPSEFQADRRMPPATKSFEPLLARAREVATLPSSLADSRSSQNNPRAIFDAAERIGERIDSPEPRDTARRADYVAAQNAVRVAQAEAQDYLRPAIDRVRDWQALGRTGRLLVRWRIESARMLKAEFWETLAMIGAAQLLVLPWIGFRPLVRIAVLVAYGAIHFGLCAWFNWDFVYGVNDNWMSRLWMTGDCRSWDGGVFGPPCWAVAILAGTLAYDLVQGATSPGRRAGRLFLFGFAFIAFGYSLSCLGRLSDVNDQELEALRERRWRQTAQQSWLDTLIEHNQRRLDNRGKQAPQGKNADASNKSSPARDPLELAAWIAVLQDQRDAYPDLDLSPSPFVPDWSRARNRALSDFLASPPFAATPRDDGQTTVGPLLEHRLWNYWMLGKRMPTLSFMTLASGLACVLYGLFVIGCDRFGLGLGVFRTFGTNALVAYFTHGMFALAVWAFIPSTSALPIALGAFCVFFTLTWLLVWQLEKRSIYIKL